MSKRKEPKWVRLISAVVWKLSPLEWGSEKEMKLARWTGTQLVSPQGTSCGLQANDLSSVAGQPCVLGKSLNFLSFSYLMCEMTVSDWKISKVDFHFYASSQNHSLFVTGVSYSVSECPINRPLSGAFGRDILIPPPCIFTWTLAICQGNHLKRQFGSPPTWSQQLFLLADAIRLKLVWFWIYPTPLTQ